jgi:hypothetical protein
MKKLLLFVVATLAIPIGAAYAIDHPPTKEGLWLVRIQTTDNPGGKTTESTMKVCRDHASENAGEAVMRNMHGCTISNESLSGNVYSLGMHCAIAGTVMESKATTVFKSDAAVHSVSHISYSPAMNGMVNETSISDQTYLGTCPAGVKPGIVH